ncbi:MAG: hypothetical protein KA734_08645 [Fluviicola sp.]|nr:hypothetical protein [Fluviicola sp.]
MFQGRKLLVATKHQKELIIGPVLEKVLGVGIQLAQNIDTDTFGTFSGEIKRLDDALSTARQKCNAALANTLYDLAIASEGSFGTHPKLFFSQVNEELVLLVDKKNNREYFERVVSLATNSNQADISNEEQLTAFAKHAQFPSHALILRKSVADFTEMYKGITDWDELIKIFHHIKKFSATVSVETDMRSMFNPMRQAVIKQATVQLAKRLSNDCPSCNSPGFGVVSNVSGLPCKACGLPTNGTLKKVVTCTFCSYKSEIHFPNNKMHEDPMYCNFCNP